MTAEILHWRINIAVLAVLVPSREQQTPVVGADKSDRKDRQSDRTIILLWLI